MLSISQNVRPSVRLFVCPCVHFWGTVQTSFYPPILEVHRDTESFGKRYEKKWSHIWKPFTNNGCKIAEQKVLVLANSGLINHQSLGQFCKVERCFVSRMWDFLFSTRNFQFVTKKIIIVCQNPLLYQPKSIRKYQKVGSLLGKWLDPVSFKT